MIRVGDALTELRLMQEKSVQMCVTSPPYWGLRDYGVDGQLGLEKTPEEYVSNLVEIFREVRRALKDDGTFWLNLGDSYFGPKGGKWEKDNYRKAREQEWLKRPDPPVHATLKTKDLVGIPWRVAFALQADGWFLRQDIIWNKPSAMPESVKDRCTKSHEYIFLFSKKQKYYFDHEAVKEPAKLDYSKNYKKEPVREVVGKGANAIRGTHMDRGGQHAPSTPGKRNRRSVWTIPSKPFKGAHFATFPPDLIEPCILAGSRPCDIVLDPFFGAGTTGLVAAKHGREYIGIELNPEYAAMAEKRINNAFPQLSLEGA